MTAGRMSAAGTSGGNNGDTDALRDCFRAGEGLSSADAIELPGESERALAFVEQACPGDNEVLRAEVESLLRQRQFRLDSFIERPAAVRLLGYLAGPTTPSGNGQPPSAREPGRPPRGIRHRGAPGFRRHGRGVPGARHPPPALGSPSRLSGADRTDGQAGDKARAGLLREARHASVQSHLCICTVYEIEVTRRRPPLRSSWSTWKARRSREAMKPARGRLAAPLGPRYGACIARSRSSDAHSPRRPPPRPEERQRDGRRASTA